MKTGTLIITGGDGGLGSAVTGRLLADGWTLHASVLNNERATALQSMFPDHWGHSLFAHVADLSQPTEVEALVQAAGEVFGLVHLAGGYKGGSSIADYTAEDFDFLMHLNVKPTFLLLRYLVPLLKSKQSGSIVIIGAKPALLPAKGNAVYAASKSAAVNLTLSTAEECRNFDVRANCIVPATLQTKNNLSWATAEQFKQFTPLEDIAAVISFLMSDAGKGITGMAIPMYNKVN